MPTISCTALCDVPDQHSTNACAGYVFSRLLQCAGVDCAPLWAYYVGRLVEGTADVDEGCTHYAMALGLTEAGTVGKPQWLWEVVPPQGALFEPIPLPVSLVVSRTMPRPRIAELVGGDTSVGCVLRITAAVEKFLESPASYAYRLVDVPEEERRNAEPTVGHSLLITGVSGEYLKMQSSYGRHYGFDGNFAVLAELVEDARLVDQFVYAHS